MLKTKRTVSKLLVSMALFSMVPVGVYAAPAEVPDPPTIPEEQLIEPSYRMLKEIITPDMEDKLIRSVISKEEETKLAQMVYGEDRRNSMMERAACIWTAFNRKDAWGRTIDSVITRGAFHGYYGSQKHPKWAHALVRDVAYRYALEKMGYRDVGRVLPREYLYFASAGNGHNRFRTGGKNNKYWNWGLPDPYKG